MEPETQLSQTSVEISGQLSKRAQIFVSSKKVKSVQSFSAWQSFRQSPGLDRMEGQSRAELNKVICYPSTVSPAVMVKPRRHSPSTKQLGSKAKVPLVNIVNISEMMRGSQAILTSIMSRSTLIRC